MESTPYTPIVDIQSHPLHIPKSLDDLIANLQNQLLKTFEIAKVSVQKCPDLRSWGLLKPGIGSINNSQASVICDVGGVPNLLNHKRHQTYFNFNNIAQAINLPNSYIIGACATAKCIVGCNAQCMPCNDCKTQSRTSHVAKVGAKGECVLEKYDSDIFGLLGNLYTSQGEQTDVIKIEASKRKGDLNFVTAIRKGLQKIVPDCGKDGIQIGMGGVFSVEQGKVKGHVMPDFKKTTMIDGPEVDEWLRFYQMGPQLTCLSVFLTDDPTKGKMNLRLEHTHFFSRVGQQGGHYHEDTTKDDIKYVGYFNFASKVYRLNNAYNEVPKI